MENSFVKENWKAHDRPHSAPEQAAKCRMNCAAKPHNQGQCHLGGPTALVRKTPMSQPDLLHLRAFMAVAERSSFRQAAKALELSPSAVSQAVRTLETRLQVPLLLRSTRSVALTQAGALLFEQLRPTLSQLDEALTAASQSGGETRGHLRLNMPRNAASQMMRPLLSGFVKAHPGVALEITTQDGLVDIVRTGHDAGIRFPESVPRDMVAVGIGPRQRFTVVASPDLATRHGLPQQPADVQRLPCVRLRFPSGVVYQWQFRRGQDAVVASVAGPVTVDDQGLALQAALDGLGWAYVYEAIAQPHLHEGRLLQALADWCPSEPGFQLYYPSRHQVSPALRALINWVQLRGEA
jgi:DNA-binding transcriptional LysR family regulator